MTKGRTRRVGRWVALTHTISVARVCGRLCKLIKVTGGLNYILVKDRNGNYKKLTDRGAGTFGSHFIAQAQRAFEDHTIDVTELEQAKLAPMLKRTIRHISRHWCWIKAAGSATLVSSDEKKIFLRPMNRTNHVLKSTSGRHITGYDVARGHEKSGAIALFPEIVVKDPHESVQKYASALISAACSGLEMSLKRVLTAVGEQCVIKDSSVVYMALGRRRHCRYYYLHFHFVEVHLFFSFYFHLLFVLIC